MPRGARSAAQVAAQKKAAAASAAARKKGAASKAAANKKFTRSSMDGKYTGQGRTPVLARRAVNKKENAYTAQAYGIKGGDAAYHSQQMREGRQVEKAKGKGAFGARGNSSATMTRAQRMAEKKSRIGAYTPGYAAKINAKTAKNKARVAKMRKLKK